jgi:hypothetical protein
MIGAFQRRDRSAIARDLEALYELFPRHSRMRYIRRYSQRYTQGHETEGSGKKEEKAAFREMMYE